MVDDKHNNNLSCFGGIKRHSDNCENEDFENIFQNFMNVDIKQTLSTEKIFKEYAYQKTVFRNKDSLAFTFIPEILYARDDIIKSLLFTYRGIRNFFTALTAIHTF